MLWMNTFKLRLAFPLSKLCEPSSFDVAHRSVLPNDLSLGSECCDEATTDAPPAMASSESLYDALVCHEDLYDILVCHEGLYDSCCTTEQGRREEDGTLDILTNLVSLQASILKKAFPTDGAN